MTMISKLAILGFAAGATFSGSVMAGSHADASVKITGYQLIDLDQQDGITAGISFIGIQNSVGTSVGFGQYGRVAMQYKGIGSDGPVSASAAMPGISGSAYNLGDTFGNLTAQGDSAADGNFDLFATYEAKFTLTPKTLLVLFGTGSLHRNQDSTPGVVANISGGYGASLSGFTNADGGGFQNSNFYFNTYYPGLPNNNNAARSFAVSFSNLDYRPLNGTFTSSAAVYGHFNGYNTPQPPSPVPEPETYAMMLAGLGLLGFMARRKKAAKLA